MVWEGSFGLTVARADEDEGSRHLLLVIGKVFTAHDRRDDFHLLFPQRLPCAGKDGFGGGAVILNGRVAGYDLDLTVGTVGLAQPLREALINSPSS